MDHNFFEVGVYKTKVEAKVAAGLLTVNGIKSFIYETRVGREKLLNFYGFSLRVLRKDYVRAKTLLGKNQA